MFRKIVLQLSTGLTLACMLGIHAQADPPTGELNKWWSPCYNCTNYGYDRRTDRTGMNKYFPNPGNIPPPPPPALTEGDIRTEAMKDKLSNIGPVPWVPGSPVPACPPGKCLVAFEFRNDGLRQDYHWFRRNADGTWTHKPGHVCARILKKKAADGGGDADNPETADRKKYRNGLEYKFGGYMCIDPATVDITNPGQPAWVRSGSHARCWTISKTGFFDLNEEAAEITDITSLLARLPTLSPISDPRWDTLPIGGIAVLADNGTFGLAPYMQVLEGAVAFYSRLDDTLTITYYADNNGLEDYLRSIGHPRVPTLSGWGIIALILLLLTLGIIAILRRRFSKPVFLGILLLTPFSSSAQVLFFDTFGDGVIATRYSSINNAGLSESGGLMTVTYTQPYSGLAINLSDIRPNCVKVDFGNSLHFPPSVGDTFFVTFHHDTTTAIGSALLVPPGLKESRVDWYKLPNGKYRVILTLVDKRDDVISETFVDVVISDDNAKKLQTDIVGNRVRAEFYDGTKFVVVTSLDPPNLPPFVSMDLISSTTNISPTTFDYFQAEEVHTTVHIPALSKWGLIILALLLAGTAVWVVWKKRAMAKGGLA